MTIGDWKDLLSNIGFPIAVTTYLLFRMERTIKELTSVIGKLCERIEK